MTDPLLPAAVAAAVRLCRRLELPPAEPSVLKDGSNVLVRVGSVVVRVATMTALVRPQVHLWLARDVAVGRFAAERGLPVVGPLPEPLAGPHHVDGFALSVWPFTPHDPTAVAAPTQIGQLLRELHAALREFPAQGARVARSGPASPPFRTRELPAHGPAADVERTLRVLDARDAEPDDLARLRDLAAIRVERAARAAAELPEQVLHGDPHPGNLLVTPDGPRWIDFEDTWCGPVAWDLACTPSALDAYPGGVDPDELAPFVELRELFGICWGLLLARRFERHRTTARERLSAFVRG